MYDVSALRCANPIAAVMGDAGVELRRAGNRLTGRCPLHADAEPSLVVYPETQSYFCFGCQAGGDVIDFVSRQRKVGFKQAAALLCGMSTACAEPEPPTCRPAPRIPPVTPEEAEIIDVAVRLFHKAFWQSRHARNTLRRRGIDEVTARRYKIGFGHPSLAADLRRAGLSLDAARHLGLLNGDRNAFGGRLIIPNMAGGIGAWLTGRSVNGEGPRYLNLRLPSPVLGLDQVAGTEVLLTEGPFDWLTLAQWGYPAAALTGTHVSKQALTALRRFRCVYLALDNDDAGRRATAELQRELGTKAVPVRLPEFAQDVNDLLSYQDGASLFEKCLAEATSDRQGERWAGPVPSAA